MEALKRTVVTDLPLGGVSIPPGGSLVETDSFSDVFADPGVLPPDGTWTVVVEAVLRINETAGVAEQVFVDMPVSVAAPEPTHVEGFAVYLDRFTLGLPTQAAAAASIH